MADETIKMGDDWRLSHDTADDWTTPVWVDQALVDSITVESSRAVAEVKKRGKDDVLVLVGKQTKSISFQVYYDPANTFVTALESAYDGKTTMHLSLADGAMATAGTEFWQFDANITELAETVDQDNVSMYSVTARPNANSENDPARGTVT